MELASVNEKNLAPGNSSIGNLRIICVCFSALMWSFVWWESDPLVSLTSCCCRSIDVNAKKGNW